MSAIFDVNSALPISIDFAFCCLGSVCSTDGVSVFFSSVFEVVLLQDVMVSDAAARENNNSFFIFSLCLFSLIAQRYK